MKRREVWFGVGLSTIAGAGLTFAALDQQQKAMRAYNAAAAESRAAMSETPEMGEFVRFATLAPSGHNVQPWRFQIREGEIRIAPDFRRRTPVVDPDDHHLFVSLGCAAENLSLAAAAHGRPAELNFDPATGEISCALGGGRPSASQLAGAIPKRQSTRADFDGQPVAPGFLRTLAGSAATPGVDVVLLTERAQLNRLSDLVIAGNTMQMADPAFVRELKSWLRFNPREALRTADGLFSATTGNPIMPDWVGPFAFDFFSTTQSQNDSYARQLRSSSGIAVFVSEQADRDHWRRAGAAAQRFALQATALGLKHAFVNQPVEVVSLRSELAALAGLSGRRPDLVMRFGYGPTFPYSARRSVGAVLA